MNDRYTTTRKAAARPIGTPAPRASYDGAELRTRSHRPGAYDAFAIPSLLFGKPSLPPPPPGMPAKTPAPVAAPRTPAEPKAYRPRPGSVAARVLDHLAMQGSTLRSKDIAALCGVEVKSVAGLLQRAVASGAIAHEMHEGKGYFSLPGARPEPASTSTSTPLSTPPHPLFNGPALQELARTEAALRSAFQQLLDQCQQIVDVIQRALDALPVPPVPPITPVIDHQVEAWPWNAS